MPVLKGQSLHDCSHKDQYRATLEKMTEVALVKHWSSNKAEKDHEETF